MSEMEVADGQIPPWLLEDDGTNGGQVSAGSHTPVAVSDRNLYAYPEPDETPASRGSSRQNQPRLANADTTVIEYDPLADAPGSATATPPPPKPVTGSAGRPGKRTTSSSRPKSPTMVTYKVRPGDSLSVIAARSNTTVAQIMKDSKLKSTTIHPGQTIKVRYIPKGYKSSKGGKGGKGARTTAAGGRTHTVAAGQTLSGIASRYGVSTASLMKANGLTQASARKILPGQKLKIPSKR